MSLDPKNIRDTLGLSQPLFAQVLGVHPVTVSKWERNEASPDSYRLILLEAASLSLKHDPNLGKKLKMLLLFGHTAAALFILLKSAQPQDLL